MNVNVITVQLLSFESLRKETSRGHSIMCKGWYEHDTWLSIWRFCVTVNRLQLNISVSTFDANSMFLIFESVYLCVCIHFDFFIGAVCPLNPWPIFWWAFPFRTVWPTLSPTQLAVTCYEKQNRSIVLKMRKQCNQKWWNQNWKS